MKETNYYVIKKKAVPEVLLKVLEVQKLLDSNMKVAVDLMGALVTGTMKRMWNYRLVKI